MVVPKDEGGFLADEESLDTWYPGGFTEPRFARVIEQASRWQDLPQPADTASTPTSNQKLGWCAEWRQILSALSVTMH
jgi:hypothetical protein